MSNSKNNDGYRGPVRKCVESMQVLNRTDNSVTFFYKRRHYNVEKYPQSTDPASPPSLDDVDDDTQRVIDNVRVLNSKIREMRFSRRGVHGKMRSFRSSGSSNSRRSSRSSRMVSSSRSSRFSGSSKSSKKTSKSSSSSSGSSKQSEPDDTEIIPAEITLIKPPKEPCDHLGVPLSNPMAVTPYPGATTAANRAKARLILRELAIRANQEEEAKERAIAMEKELEQYKKKSKEKTEKSSSKSSKKTSKKSKKSSKKSKKKQCKTCGTCRKCAFKCNNKHFEITDKERERFFDGINNLRKKLIKPESSRENAHKSPYDVTQSSSEASVCVEWKENKKKKTKN